MKTTIEIEHGENTCAVKPGKFCIFLGAKRFGQEPWCVLFDARLFDKCGWVQRCSKCKAMDRT
jgi:hypothetical protein